jgi:hypothetical protein
MKILGILLAVIVVGIAAYKLAYPTTVYRFRITLSVDTPRGLKTGSGVMEVRHRSYPAWTTLGNNTWKSTLTGEAVFVDLGTGDDGRQKNLVALLVYGQRGDHNLGFVPGIVFAPFWKGKSIARGTAHELSNLPVGTRARLPSDLTPTLITFLDVRDPNTARAVPPDNAESVLGRNTHFLGAELEIVAPGRLPFDLFGFGGVPVTKGLETHLPWLDGPDRPAVRALKAAGLYLGESELTFRRIPK